MVTRDQLIEDYSRIIDEQKLEIKKLREGLSLVVSNIGNGAFASPECSLEFLTVEVPKEVKLVCESYRRQIEYLKLKLV